MEQYRIRNIKRAKTAGKILRFVPFVRLAGLNGSLAREEDNERSDIDFLIIAKKNRLYTARFFATLFLRLAFIKREKNKIAGRICLNCFLSSDDLDITPVKNADRNHVAISNKYLVVFIDSGGYTRKFFQENAWIGEIFTKTKKREKKLDGFLSVIPRKPVGLFEPILKGLIGDIFENVLAKYQMARIEKGIHIGDEIYVSRSKIRLHPKKPTSKK